MSEPKELDVTVIPPQFKHSTIFETFEALEPGTSFILVNDHDPRPLRYQFESTRAGTFEWTYREEGPYTWKVEIKRTA